MRAFIELQHFPQYGKKAVAIPVKKPNKIGTDPTNYRPISLLPALGTLLKQLINDRPKRFDQHLKPQQFGFRS